MAKIFKDFIYMGKRFSELRNKYIPIQFEDSDTGMLSLERNMEIGTTNPYKIEGNYFGDTWADTLPLTIDIVKNPCIYTTQQEQAFTQEDIREFTRWLTSNHYPEWLEFIYEPGDTTDAKFYRGWFNNIETFVVGGTVYGLTLRFKCTSPFAYTSDFINKVELESGYNTCTIVNNNDELDSFCYPRIRIHPKANGYVAICNKSDCNVIETGILSNPTLPEQTYFDILLDACESYAKSNGYDLTYAGTGTFNIVPLCDETAVQFYLIDKYHTYEWKCTAFFNPLDKRYEIVSGGFMFLKVNTSLDIHIDCQKLIITDDLNRMITYDKLGINNADFMYWLRYVNGQNNLLLYGKADFTFTHKESRKVGEK